MTPAFPKRGPDAGTMDQVRPQCGPWHQNTLIVDWPTYPLQTPSGGGLRADPGQKQDPGERMLASGKEGLTNRGPLQKGRNNDRHDNENDFESIEYESAYPDHTEHYGDRRDVPAWN